MAGAKRRLAVAERLTAGFAAVAFGVTFVAIRSGVRRRRTRPSIRHRRRRRRRPRLHTIVLHGRQHDAATKDYTSHAVSLKANTPRRNTPTQALPRPPPLPTTRTCADDRLTDIEASLAQGGVVSHRGVPVRRTHNHHMRADPGRFDSHLERVLQAPRERVFAACVEPEQLPSGGGRRTSGTAKRDWPRPRQARAARQPIPASLSSG